jgi:integrase
MASKAGRRIGKLSARFVETVKARGFYGDGGGLYLKVHGGSKSWIVRWSSAGKVRKIGLGSAHTVSLIDARRRAEEVRAQLHDGIDPRTARRAKQQSITFDQARDRYIEAHQVGWKHVKHCQQWRSSLQTYASPIFGDLPVGAIDTALVLRAIQPIWSVKTETASRVRNRIEIVLSWAKVHGYREGENPATWRGHLDHLLPKPGKVHKVRHHSALPYAQLPAFMTDLRDCGGIAATALEFLILTATRTSETLNAVWGEIDLDNKLWIISRERMKGGREHRVPLCDRAVAIVREMQATKRSEFVFPGAKHNKPLSTMSMLTTLRRMGRADVTTHGMRATFRTWAAERTHVQREVIEAALAHVIGDRTEAAYQRGDLLDKRRALMKTWGEFCDRGTTSGVVIALR